MRTIVPPPTDDQVDNRHFTCPNCAAPAQDTNTHADSELTLLSSCLCPNGHVWTTRWLVSD